MKKLAHFQSLFRAYKCCVLIPTFNNAQSLGQVIQDVLIYTDQVMVVNDGSTDDTPDILNQFPDIHVVSYPFNKGKGHALQTGFIAAREKGYEYAISIDADGQHFADDLPTFIEQLGKTPGTLIVGARNMDQEGIPRGSSFGNKFSNFWFKLETGIDLPDTQSGYRLYPLNLLKDITFRTTKYEFEIEVMVKAAWEGIPICAVPVKVYYAPKETRISHFRPYKDFARISVLNTFLVIMAIFYYRPRQLFREIKKKSLKVFLKEQLLNSDESHFQKSLAAGLGVFMGIVPIWGYQLVAAIGLAHLFKLNKGIVILTANVSLPPMIPFILYGSFRLGQLLLPQANMVELSLDQMNLEMVKTATFQYVIGSFSLAILAATICALITYLLLWIFVRKPSKKIEIQG